MEEQIQVAQLISAPIYLDPGSSWCSASGIWFWDSPGICHVVSWDRTTLERSGSVSGNKLWVRVLALCSEDVGNTGILLQKEWFPADPKPSSRTWVCFEGLSYFRFLFLCYLRLFKTVIYCFVLTFWKSAASYFESRVFSKLGTWYLELAKPLLFWFALINLSCNFYLCWIAPGFNWIHHPVHFPADGIHSRFGGWCTRGLFGGPQYLWHRYYRLVL